MKVAIDTIDSMTGERDVFDAEVEEFTLHGILAAYNKHHADASEVPLSELGVLTALGAAWVLADPDAQSVQPDSAAFIAIDGTGVLTTGIAWKMGG